MGTAGRWSLAAGALLAGAALSAVEAPEAEEAQESEAGRAARRCVYRTFETPAGDNMAFVRVGEHARAQRWIEENPFTFAEVVRWIGAGEEFAIEDERRRGLAIEALLRECRGLALEELVEDALSPAEVPG